LRDVDRAVILRTLEAAGWMIGGPGELLTDWA
jgi:predicted type IV restriction endonuclease